MILCRKNHRLLDLSYNIVIDLHVQQKKTTTNYGILGESRHEYCSDSNVLRRSNPEAYERASENSPIYPWLLVNRFRQSTRLWLQCYMPRVQPWGEPSIVIPLALSTVTDESGNSSRITHYSDDSVELCTQRVVSSSSEPKQSIPAKNAATLVVYVC